MRRQLAAAPRRAGPRRGGRHRQGCGRGARRATTRTARRRRSGAAVRPRCGTPYRTQGGALRGGLCKEALGVGEQSGGVHQPPEQPLLLGGQLFDEIGARCQARDLQRGLGPGQPVPAGDAALVGTRGEAGDSLLRTATDLQQGLAPGGQMRRVEESAVDVQDDEAADARHEWKHRHCPSAPSRTRAARVEESLTRSSVSTYAPPRQRAPRVPRQDADRPLPGSRHL